MMVKKPRSIWCHSTTGTAMMASAAALPNTGRHAAIRRIASGHACRPIAAIQPIISASEFEVSQKKDRLPRYSTARDIGDTQMKAKATYNANFRGTRVKTKGHKR